MGTMGNTEYGGCNRSVITIAMAVSIVLGTALVIVPEPIEGPPNPIPIVNVSLSPASLRATVTDQESDHVVFHGNVTVDQLSKQRTTVTLEGTIEYGWMVVLSWESDIIIGPMTLSFDASVDVPAGEPAGKVGNLVVTAKAEVPILQPIVSTAGSQVIVRNTDPPPRWSIRIEEPLEGAIVTGNTVTVSGTASYDGGAITSVEVKACTGPWVKAEGTSEWTIESDMTLMDDGLHLITVRARSEDKTSPLFKVNITQDRSSTTVDQGDGGDPPPTTTPEKEGWSAYDYILLLVVIVAVLGGAYAYNNWRQKSMARSWIDRYGS